MPCICRAHAVHTQCTCRAHAVRMPCTYLREAAIVDACGCAPPSPPRAVPTAHVHCRRQRLQRCTLAAAAAALAPTPTLALALSPSLIFALAAALTLALAPTLALALALDAALALAAALAAALDGGQARRAGVPSLEGARRPALHRLVRLPQSEVAEEGPARCGAEPTLEGLQQLRRRQTPGWEEWQRPTHMTAASRQPQFAAVPTRLQAPTTQRLHTRPSRVEGRHFPPGQAASRLSGRSRTRRAVRPTGRARGATCPCAPWRSPHL